MLAFLPRFLQCLAEQPAGGVEQSLKFLGFAVPVVGLEPPGLWTPGLPRWWHCPLGAGFGLG